MEGPKEVPQQQQLRQQAQLPHALHSAHASPIFSGLRQQQSNWQQSQSLQAPVVTQVEHDLHDTQ